MDVIKTEHLQQNAARVGELLLRECQALRPEFPLIGDVRGSGLFIGLELVRVAAATTGTDESVSTTLRPATAEAQAIVARMKSRHHILISSDGPDSNVLKLKPPMVFNEQNAGEFLRALRECLLWTAERAVVAAEEDGGAMLNCSGVGTKEKVVPTESVMMAH